MRDKYLDFLRCVGLLLIVLAHVGTSGIVMHVRVFDVPLMLFVSGLSFGNKELDGKRDIANYFLKRIKRLLFPVYIFLAGYFIIQYSLYLAGLSSSLNKNAILGSFLLLEEPGVGYVWIIRVQLLVVLITPLLANLATFLRTRYPSRFHLRIGFVTVVMLMLLEICCVFILPMTVFNKYIHVGFYETIPFMIAYSVPFLLGSILRTEKNTHGLLIFYSILFIALYSSYYLKSGVIDLQHFKYPPRAIFVLYGVFCSLILWVAKPLLKRVAELKFFSFVGQNTLWIYLWHIPFVNLSSYIPNVLLRYIFVLMGAVSIFYLQRIIVNKCLPNSSSIKKYFLG
ncbi:MAG: acyltransferase [Bacteroidales bacterium]|nr:acyltransferase [Bacteroidales bacterium]